MRVDQKGALDLKTGTTLSSIAADAAKIAYAPGFASWGVAGRRGVMPIVRSASLSTSTFMASASRTSSGVASE